MNKPNSNNDFDQLFRKSYGKLTAILLSKYGTQHLEDVENAIMESYYKALKTWPYKGNPDNPEAWLLIAAKNAFLNELKKKQKFSSLDAITNAENLVKEEANEQTLTDEIKDPELKLLFLVSHPDLKAEDRLAFMLKTLSGLGDHEISSALMINKATIKKRLLRARNEIKERKLKFDWPSPKELESRIEFVHTSLYLLFNEGFYSSHPKHWMRKELCLEAMRLCKFLVDHFLANADTAALMSLMCYHISRYQSRLDEEDNAILLKDQDRTKWDPFFIQLGNFYLEKSADIDRSGTQKSKYQIEAFISAQHCMAKDLESTNWPLLKDLYNALYIREKQDLILLNLILVHLQINEVNEAKALFEKINVQKFRGNKSVYYMVGVELYQKLQDVFQTELMLEQAIQNAQSIKESDQIKQKLNAIRKNKSD